LFGRALQCLSDITVIASCGGITIECGAIGLGECGAVAPPAGTRVPFDLQRLRGPLGAPETVGNYRYGVVEVDNCSNATERFRRGVIDALDRATRYWAPDNRGIDHPRHFSVDAVGGAAIDLKWHIETGFWCAGERVGLRRLERRLLAEHHLGGVGG